MLHKTVFLVLLYITLTANSARILGIFDFPSKSHHILGSALLKSLADRGHQVTMISPFPPKTPLRNYQEIELVGVLDYKDRYLMQSITKKLETGRNPFYDIKSVYLHLSKLMDMTLNHTVENLLKSNRKFDLIIQNWMSNTAYLGIAHHFNASVIAFSAAGSTHLTNELTGNTNPYSYVPHVMFGFPSEMTFLQRVQNTVGSLLIEQLIDVLNGATQVQLLEKYFPGAPPPHELQKKISLVLLNSHFSLESPRPYVPSLIQIGGFHLEEPKELSGELKKFMDSANEGVLYFSLGSNIKSADLPTDKLSAIVKTFAKLPVKVLWKFEIDDLPKLPSNVRVQKWLPQTGILAHPNLRVFVSHGGLLSTTEAIHHGVPVVGMPLFADQANNIADAISKGFAVKVDLNELNEDTLTAAITEVLTDSKYRNNAKQISRLMRDQPVKPMDNAIFWVEYVLRHNGAHHLKTAALKLQWYQYFLLDVIALLLGIVAVVVAGSYFFIVKLLRVLRRVSKKYCRKMDRKPKKE